MINNFERLLEKAKTQKTMRLSVAAAQDEEVLMAVHEAHAQGLIEPVLVGDGEKIKEIASKNNIDIRGFQIVDEKDLTQAARTAVELVSTGKADFVMKGILSTADLLRAVLDKEIGLRTDSQLSHVMVYESENYHKLLMLTDGGMNIAPTLEEKVKILSNSLRVCKAMGIDNPKVACLAAVEVVNPKMQATLDAAELKKMGQEQRFGSVEVDGPVALDLAISKEAAKHKGYSSEVAGDADVLLVPTIEMGNGIGKSLTYFAKAKSAGIVMGAKVPIVLVSRADSHEAKLYSIALGSIIAAN
jgi:phosphate butyryltransferase